ncbi:MAG: UDP-N-acetylmuramoyl-L-alanine--D-glutamate ligase, partial [Anaerolineales bacterium]
MAKEGSPYRKTFVGGNIGTPMIAVVDQMTSDDLAVMELSSFQLELMSRSPHVAAVLNIAPNHLDRHGTMEAYTAAKLNILRYQSSEDVAVLWRDDIDSWSLAERVRGRLYSYGRTQLPNGEWGSFIENGSIWLRTGEGQVEVMPIEDNKLRGEHNLLNVTAACIIAAAVGLPVEAMRAGVEGFTGVPHRLELVRSWGGADWFNDSKATAPQMAVTAIKAFDEPLVVLAGGRDKHLPWDEFAQVAAERVDHLILFGEAVEVIRAALDDEAA